MSMSSAYDAVLPHVNNVSYFSVIDWLHLNTCVDTQRSSSSFMSATVSSVQFVYLFFILHQYIQFKGKMPPNNAFKGLLHCFPQIFNSIFLFLSWNLLWQYDNVELRYKAMFPVSSALWQIVFKKSWIWVWWRWDSLHAPMLTMLT